jgi:hypothetical protein
MLPPPGAEPRILLHKAATPTPRQVTLVKPGSDWREFKWRSISHTDRVAATVYRDSRLEPLYCSGIELPSVPASSAPAR